MGGVYLRAEIGRHGDDTCRYLSKSNIRHVERYLMQRLGREGRNILEEFVDTVLLMRIDLIGEWERLGGRSGLKNMHDLEDGRAEAVHMGCCYMRVFERGQRGEEGVNTGHPLSQVICDISIRANRRAEELDSDSGDEESDCSWRDSSRSWVRNSNGRAATTSLS